MFDRVHIRRVSRPVQHLYLVSFEYINRRMVWGRVLLEHPLNAFSMYGIACSSITSMYWASFIISWTGRRAPTPPSKWGENAKCSKNSDKTLVSQLICTMLYDIGVKPKFQSTRLAICSSTALVLRWYCVGIALVLRWYCVGIALVLRWYCVGIALVLRWYCVGIALVLPWYCLGIALVLPWYSVLVFRVGIPVLVFHWYSVRSDEVIYELPEYALQTQRRSYENSSYFCKAYSAGYNYCVT